MFLQGIFNNNIYNNKIELTQSLNQNTLMGILLFEFILSNDSSRMGLTKVMDLTFAFPREICFIPIEKTWSLNIGLNFKTMKWIYIVCVSLITHKTQITYNTQASYFLRALWHYSNNKYAEVLEWSLTEELPKSLTVAP